MKLNKEFEFEPRVCEQENKKSEAIDGLKASLNSSSSIKAILDCAKERCERNELAETRLKRIEKICSQYENHQQSIRDHCLDVSSLRQGEFPEWIEEKTDKLMRKGKAIFSELSEAILLFA